MPITYESSVIRLERAATLASVKACLGAFGDLEFLILLLKARIKGGVFKNLCVLWNEDKQV